MAEAPVCPVCGGRDSLPAPAEGTCAHCYNHMLTWESYLADVSQSIPMSDDSLISCPPCRSPARCVGGVCAFQEDKRQAALEAYGLGIVPIRWITKEELVQLYPPPSQGGSTTSEIK